MDIVVDVEDVGSDDVRALIDQHLRFAITCTPAGHVCAVGAEGLAEPSVTLYGLRTGTGELLGMGALRRLDASHAEVKSMHVSEAARGQGLGAALLDHLLRSAAGQGYRRVSLETGTMASFAPARALYRRFGFVVCPPFGAYTTNPYSVCMSVALDPQ